MLLLNHVSNSVMKSSGMKAAATGVAGQLMLLESKLNQRGSAKIDDGNDGSSTVEERLALLLQVR